MDSWPSLKGVAKFEIVYDVGVCVFIDLDEIFWIMIMITLRVL